MHQEICLHGHLDEAIEYFAVMAAHDAYARYFFETDANGLRFFAPGNEFILGHDQISYRGNGGSFCRYMFGVDQPLADLCKSEVRNRLILYGAFCTEDGQLEFTDQTEGYSSYERIFTEGNALHNYFFFLNGSVVGPLKEQQESLARLLGRTLKRSAHVGGDDDTCLLNEIYGLLGHKSSLCMVKLVHKHHRSYHDAFRGLYFSSKKIAEKDFQDLQKEAEGWRIDRSQQERIRIDVMYQHPDNRRIVDEYRNILIDGHRRGLISQSDQDRLSRLKTLSIRSKIPAALFAPFDDLLRPENSNETSRKDYLSVTRQVLGGIFLAESQIDASITVEDVKLLLHAKRRASELHDRTFEQILLETGKTCDEKIHRGSSRELLEQFSQVIASLDRYDTTYACFNELVFMDNPRFIEDKIRSLLDNKQAFDKLDPSLWQELFFDPVYANPYLGRIGRKKADCLAGGLPAIESGKISVEELRGQLCAIEEEGQFYAEILALAKDRIRNFYSRYTTRAEQDALYVEISSDLAQKGSFDRDLSPMLFRDVLVNINTEAVYVHNLLPKIIAENDNALREDFLANSGLDRFYVEELEREYFELNGLSPEQLQLLRKGAAA